MKLTPRLNFINVLRAGFFVRTSFPSYVLALNELLYKKGVQKNVDEIEPRFVHIAISTNFFGQSYKINVSI